MIHLCEFKGRFAVCPLVLLDILALLAGICGALAARLPLSWMKGFSALTAAATAEAAAMEAAEP